MNESEIKFYAESLDLSVDKAEEIISYFSTLYRHPRREIFSALHTLTKESGLSIESFFGFATEKLENHELAHLSFLEMINRFIRCGKG